MRRREKGARNSYAPAAPTSVRYQVRRAQAAVNHQVREHGIPGWTKPLAVDGHLGPKTGAALDAWAKSVGAPPVTGEPGAQAIEVSPSFAKVLDEAQIAAVVAFAPPQAVPEDDAPWMAIARGELGQKEIKGAEDNPRIREYDGTFCETDFPWNDVPRCDAYEELRNCVFARFGYVFSKPKWQKQFGAMPWYKPDPGFTEAKLPAVAKANVQKLKDLKAKKQGCE